MKPNTMRSKEELLQIRVPIYKNGKLDGFKKVSKAVTEDEAYGYEFKDQNEDEILRKLDIVNVFKAEGWHPKTKREVALQVDEFIDATLGWPTVPRFTTVRQKQIRQTLINQVLANRKESKVSRPRFKEIGTNEMKLEEFTDTPNKVTFGGTRGTDTVTVLVNGHILALIKRAIAGNYILDLFTQEEHELHYSTYATKTEAAKAAKKVFL